MSDVTGAYHHAFGEKTYRLRLTLGGIAKLQGRHGDDLGGLLSGKYAKKEGDMGPAPIPPFGIMLDVVAVALEKGEALPADEAADLADDLMTADRNVFSHVMTAAFPDSVGNEKPPRAKRA
ncbi:hypothetical protein [Falsirhodobacter halotolerans]|uniref:hypothetical protein n=1 Tax=Falsirhodobacter halotolerans TaxID=1146892 RepID=UPI001FD2A9AB|nr:hypothetical protein [Falsirhodobacter halotolerans]MCJ8138433.1 hypothetical protein [Falsirhodobacter halotolerans]